MNTPVLISMVCSSILAIDAVSMKQRVIGGEPARKFEYPHQALLIVDDKPLAGAVLITRKELLTGAFRVAAVIAKKPTKSRAIIKLALVDARIGIPFDVSRISHHPGFKVENGIHYNDIAVVHLLHALEDDNLAIKPIARPHSTSRIPGGTGVYISGFDSIIQNKVEITFLAKIYMTTTRDSECQRRIQGHYTVGLESCILTSINIGCAVCDVGNGMIDRSKSVVLGIFSRSIKGSTRYEAANIFTQVAPYYHYIDNEITYFTPNRSTGDEIPAVNFPWFAQRLF